MIRTLLLSTSALVLLGAPARADPQFSGKALSALQARAASALQPANALSEIAAAGSQAAARANIGLGSLATLSKLDALSASLATAQPTSRPDMLMARSLALHLNDRLSLYDFGARCDAVQGQNGLWTGTDDTTPIQNAMNSGRPFDIPDTGVSGGCIFSSGLQVNMPARAMRGFGMYSSHLIYAATSANPNPSTTIDLLSVSQLTAPSATAGAPGYGHATFEGFSIESSIVMTGGAAIHQFNEGFDTYRNVAVGSLNTNLFHGFWFDQIDYTSVLGYFARAQQDDVRVSGFGRPDGTHFSAPQYDLYMAYGRTGGGKVGYHLGGGFDNAWFDNSANVNSTNVLVDNAIRPYSNQHYTFGAMFMSENSSGPGVVINDAKSDQTVFSVATFLGHYDIAQLDGASPYANPLTTAVSNGAGIDIRSMPGGEVIIKAQEIQGNAGPGVLVEDQSVRLTMDASTQVVYNSYGVSSTAPLTALSLGRVYNNTNGNLQNVTAPLTNPGQITSATSGGGATASFLATAPTNASYGWKEQAAGTDNKVWDMIANGGNLDLRAVNDANNATSSVMHVARSGMGIANISFPAPLSTAKNVVDDGAGNASVKGNLQIGAATQLSYAAPAIQATGTSCSAPTALTRDLNVVTNGAGNYVGLSGLLGQQQQIWNATGGTLNVCPPNGAGIGSGAANAAVAMAAGGHASFGSLSATQSYQSP